jgi:hypothetical protein
MEETLSRRAAVREEGLPPLIVLTMVTGAVDALAYLRLGGRVRRQHDRQRVFLTPADDRDAARVGQPSMSSSSVVQWIAAPIER